MKKELAEALLAKIMDWTDEEKAHERARLETFASYKYDEYQQFSPGRRFIESLALWLAQFDAGAQRRTAYAFVCNSLIFFSASEVMVGDEIRFYRASERPYGAFSIVTAGRSGLEVRHAGTAHRCEALDADIVRDTCGAGDMVTLGLLDTIIQNGVCGPPSLSLSTVMMGVRSGQRLAAANCAYIGARGIFRERGPQHARAILAET